MKDEIKKAFAENYKILIQLFIFIGVFCVSASALTWNKDASLADAFAYISIFTIANIMTFNNAVGYGGDMFRRTDEYLTPYNQNKKMIGLVLKFDEGICHIDEYLEKKDKLEYELLVKNELRMIRMTFDNWCNNWAKAGSNDIKKNETLTAKEKKTLLLINKIRSPKTNADKLLGYLKTKHMLKLSKETRLLIKNIARLIKFIFVGALFAYISFNRNGINADTINEFLITMLPLTWAFVTGLGYGKTLELDNVAEFNENTSTLKGFIEWLKHTKGIKLEYEKNIKEVSN